VRLMALSAVSWPSAFSNTLAPAHHQARRDLRECRASLRSIPWTKHGALAAGLTSVLCAKQTGSWQRRPTLLSWPSRLHGTRRRASEAGSEARVEVLAQQRLQEWLEVAEEQLRAALQGSLAVEGSLTAATVRATAEALEDGLVERTVEVRVLLLAALCGEHVLVLGPPGTAKSALARRLAWLGGPDAIFFERLLTRFSVPEELFGPLSLKALEQDEYVRQTEGYLPTASIAFVDEIFKANSAILNSLLSIINERVFDNGISRVGVPLRCLVAASNELPESDELAALFDRFLFRLSVEPVSDSGIKALVKAATNSSRAVMQTTPLSLEDMGAVLAEVADAEVEVPDDVIEVLRGARQPLVAREPSPLMLEQREPASPLSDRRLGQAARMLQIAAWTNGRRRVERADCALLQHVLWSSPEEQKPTQDYLVRSIAGSRGRQIAALLAGVMQRASAGSSTEDEIRREVRAFRALLISEVSNVLRQQRLLREHCWLAAEEANSFCGLLDMELDRPGSGPRWLLAEVATLDAAAELRCLKESVQAGRDGGKFQWGDVELGSDGVPANLGDAEDQTFIVGKHKGKRFSEVVSIDVDYCQMVRRKVEEGQFSKDTRLDRQVRAFVKFLRRQPPVA